MRQEGSAVGREWIGVLCGVLMLLGAVPFAAVNASPGASYGHDFIRAGKSWPEEAPVAHSVDVNAVTSP